MLGSIKPRMGNGLKGIRERRGWTQERAAREMGMPASTYIKKEQGVRGLSGEFIKRACEVFGVEPKDILSELSSVGGPVEAFLLEIDEEKLASFVAQAKDRIASMTEVEARNLVLALISAARKPPNPSKP